MPEQAGQHLARQGQSQHERRGGTGDWSLAWDEASGERRRLRRGKGIARVVYGSGGGGGGGGEVEDECGCEFLEWILLRSTDGE